MYAIVWVPEHTSTGATSTTQTVKIDNYFEHEIGADGTLTVHCLHLPAPRPDRQIPAGGFSRGQRTSFPPQGWVLFELFGADGTRFKAKRPHS